jgi:hypothetical protein
LVRRSTLTLIGVSALAAVAFGLALLAFGGSDDARDLAAQIPQDGQLEAGTGYPQVEAQSSVSDSTGIAPPSKPEANGEESGESGIGVHGHWTISILDPDGTLVRRIEFDNALEPNGNEVLARLLTGEDSVDSWRILLILEPGPFLIASIGEPGDSPVTNDDLTVQRTGSSGTSVVELRGSFISTGATINTVTTQVTLDNGSTTQSLPFTSTTIPLVAPADGQLVQVAADLTFGTLAP